MKLKKATPLQKAKIVLSTAVAGLLFAAPLCGQTPTVPATTGTLHGSVTDPTGLPVTKGDIKFTTNKTAASSEEKNLKFDYDFPLDASGNYVATGVKPGDYYVIVYQDGKHLDYQDVVIKAGDDKTVNFDMTREEYLKELTPESRKAFEEARKKNAEALSVNKVVNNLNATLGKVRADLAAAAPTKDDVSKDVADMLAATQAKPDEGLLWFVYGYTLQSQAEHLVKADRAAGTVPLSDDAVTKSYSEAVDAYKKAADLNAASKKPDMTIQSSAYNQMGNVLAKAGKLTDSQAAFENAVKLAPANAGMYFGNEAAVLFNANQPEAALAAAEKAIAADPTRPDPYFIKGQALITKATLDPKTNLLVAPPGCTAAYQTYLQLTTDPNGANAQTAKDVLTGLGEKIDTSYKAGKKKS